MYFLMAQDIIPSNEASTAQQFVLDQYVEMLFQDIMPNIGVAKVLTARKNQFKALQRKMPKIKLDTTRTNETTISFGSKIPLNSIGTVQVFIYIGITNFYVIDTPTLFLLCLKNIDILSIYLNNITNQLIC